MKDFKNLIKELKKMYKENLQIDVFNLNEKTEINIYGLNFISNSTIDYIKDYCTYIIIAGSTSNKIKVTLIIEK